ncbi:MAG: transposase [Prevotella sp.]|nr:transposase [Prevotella sp.]
MATFKILVQKQRTDGYWPVYIRVTHHRVPYFMKTDKMVDNRGLIKSTKEIKDPFVKKELDILVTDYIDRLNKVDISTWTVHEVVQFLKEGNSDVCFSDYAREYQTKMILEGHARNARTYELSYQNLERYAGTTKVMFSHLTSAFINGWIKSLSDTARAKEQYPVCVRQIFKQALLEFNDYDTGLLRIKTNPWPKVKIPKSDTPRKRAITMEDCRKFFAAPLPDSDRKYPLPELGRDVAMMILCLAGINTVDLYFAEKKNHHDNIIGYERRKTRDARADNAWFEIRVPDIIKPIVEKYIDTSDSDYLFNFHKRFSTYDSFNANVNIGIRQICEKVLNIKHGEGYSGYTFRHTWATVAQNECEASLADVDFGLNHSHKTQMARTYVKIDFTPAWKLNEKVVDKIFFTEEKSSANKSEEPENVFTRFSFKQLMKGTIYFKGKIIASVEDVGFNNVEEIITLLMKELPETIPPRSLVQIRICNKDKNQIKDYTRMVH